MTLNLPEKKGKRIQILLCKNGYYKGFYLDCLIGLAFLEDKQITNVKNDVYDINGNVSDNRPENLDWKHRGVRFNKQMKKWIAQIMINKEHKYLGSFDSKQEAGEAYMKAYENRLTQLEFSYGGKNEA